MEPDVIYGLLYYVVASRPAYVLDAYQHLSVMSRQRVGTIKCTKQA